MKLDVDYTEVNKKLGGNMTYDTQTLREYNEYIQSRNREIEHQLRTWELDGGKDSYE